MVGYVASRISVEVDKTRRQKLKPIKQTYVVIQSAIR